jgi:hypothetical protein
LQLLRCPLSIQRLTVSGYPLVDRRKPLNEHDQSIDKKDNLTVSYISKMKFIRLLNIGFIVAAGFSYCVVYAHPYHPYYHHG